MSRPGEPGRGTLGWSESDLRPTRIGDEAGDAVAFSERSLSGAWVQVDLKDLDLATEEGRRLMRERVDACHRVWWWALLGRPVAARLPPGHTESRRWRRKV